MTSPVVRTRLSQRALMLKPDMLKHASGCGVVVRHVDPCTEETQRVEYVLQHSQSSGGAEPAVPALFIPNQHRHLRVAQRLVNRKLTLADVMTVLGVDREDVSMRLMMRVVKYLIPFCLRRIDHLVRFIT